jgi:hypothetical protein
VSKGGEKKGTNLLTCLTNVLRVDFRRLGAVLEGRAHGCAITATTKVPAELLSLALDVVLLVNRKNTCIPVVLYVQTAHMGEVVHCYGDVAGYILLELLKQRVVIVRNDGVINNGSHTQATVATLVVENGVITVGNLKAEGLKELNPVTHPSIIRLWVAVQVVQKLQVQAFPIFVWKTRKRAEPNRLALSEFDLSKRAFHVHLRKLVTICNSQQQDR